MKIIACIYSMKKSGPYKSGVAIGPDSSDIQVIVDSTTCRPISGRPYNFTLLPGEGCVEIGEIPIIGKLAR